jgi:hypothetical protein
MLKPEIITKSQQVGMVQQRAFYEEDAKMTIEEEESGKPVPRTHGQLLRQSFGNVQQKRPQTAHAFPHLASKVPNSSITIIEIRRND